MTSPEVSASVDPQPLTDPAAKARSQKAANKIRGAETRQRVWDYRREGYDFKTIAALMAKDGHPISAQRAHKIVQEELAELTTLTRQTVEEHRTLSVARIERQQARLASACAKGSVQAVRAWRQLEETKAKLLGLFAPMKVEIDDNRWARLTQDELETELRQGAAKLGFTLVPAG